MIRMLSTRTFCGVCALVFLSAATPSAPAQQRPNILLIVADDLGYSDLGCYGGEIETPTLDRLGETGVRLTSFYTMARCCPSRACVLTGEYPHKVGVGHKVADLGRPGYRGRIPETTPTIADLLRQNNYRTFVSGKWHLGTPDPTENGFEEFYGTLVSAQTFWEPDHYLRMPRHRAVRTDKPGEFYGTDALTDQALDFLNLARQTEDQPWFLYLAFNAPHFPLHAPPEDIAKYSQRYHDGWDEVRKGRLTRMQELGILPASTRLTPRSPYWNYGETDTGDNPPWASLPADRRADLARRMAIYAAMIDRMDQNIQRVVNDLKAHQEFSNTLIIFLSDNGACAEWDPYGFDIKSSNQNILHTGKALDRMGSAGTFHSVGSGWANASNTPWRLYKHYTHEGGISSPCLLHWPAGQLRSAALEHRSAHLIDILPTILDAADSTTLEKRQLPGISLLPRLRESSVTADQSRALFFEHEGNRAVIRGHWKLVALRDAPWELYDMRVDRTELVNLAATRHDLVEELAKLWSDWAAANHVTPLPQDYGVDYLRKVAEPAR